MAAKKPKPCKDAGDDSNHLKRPAPHPGPRCASCWRAEKRRRKEAAHRTYVAKTYGVERDFYDLLYAFQEGKCALCRRATGATKRLANDHDHKCCPGPIICGQCLRGLLCGPCNEIIGRWGDNPDIFLRGFWYLINPPARQLREQMGVITDGHDRERAAGADRALVTVAAVGGSTLPSHDAITQ